MATLNICSPAWPDWMRRSHASSELPDGGNGCGTFFGNVRVASVPS